MQSNNQVRGIRFIGRNKALIDIKRHADIMEDAIDRIKVKEAMEKGEFVPWDEVEKKIEKKLSSHGIPNPTNKKSRKKPAKSRQTLPRKSS